MIILLLSLTFPAFIISCYFKKEPVMGMRNHWIQISESSPKRYLPGQRHQEVGGKRLTQRCHHQNDFCIETGSDESHYVPLIVRSKVTKPCTQTTTFEEGGEPKRN